MEIRFANAAAPKAGALALLVHEGRVLTEAGRAMDEATGGALVRAMEASRFEGKRDQQLVIVAPAGVALTRIVLCGAGKAGEADAARYQALGGAVAAAFNAAGDKEGTILIDGVEGEKSDLAEAAAEAAFGARMRSYRFDKYRTTEKPEKKPTLERLTIAATNSAKRVYAAREAVADGVFLTRDLVSEPGNILYPETLADAAKALKKDGVTVEVLDEKAIRKLGMGALIGVAIGSVRPPRVVVMQWNGGRKGEAPIAFVGKGVTFDTGGISIKPAGGMEDMKWDMAGAGVVIGLMRALARREAAVNAVAVVALVENMPSGSAQRPGDVVTSMSGQTIEVLNTDAEGRLILADACWYCQDRFKPQAMINLATLTGAIIVALGDHHAGLFSNDDTLSERLAAAGKSVGEQLWRLPLADYYDKQIDSDIADVKNIAANRGAGSIIGAQFIQRFVNKVPWAHLDIAGVTWSKADTAITPKGATAFGLRLLDRLVADHYEGK
ncbi:leucyl aminopeptidase [Stella humosa]|uniref:Probable cytosol aminopeptidase n=1 Tax=Stella humosa TaxID=94 RepID=A0A3N1M780_9PROT|nr:leucyl aminopeptidase [Stella humosa]ROP99510.1 leucyl aminopeptidase [Stella humosa]BBK31276.1 putative cytosol aminopeptidase [Stella humosa]